MLCMSCEMTYVKPCPARSVHYADSANIFVLNVCSVNQIIEFGIYLFFLQIGPYVVFII